MPQPFPKPPGWRRALRASAPAQCALLLAGCVYSFTGGGLPGHIRTVAVLPFENSTAQGALAGEMIQQLQTDLPRKLGVRLADQRVATAVVRGRITGYEEAAGSIRPSTTPGGNSRVDIPVMEVRITFEAEIYDVRQDRPLWKQSGISAVGRYQPGREQSTAGRRRALEEVVQKIIDGAQSQW